MHGTPAMISLTAGALACSQKTLGLQARRVPPDKAMIPGVDP